MQHRISAGAIVDDGDRLLMVRHLRADRDDFWVCPGGGVEGNESLQDAARREAREETGLELQIGPLGYIEERMQPGMPHCKFWFIGRALGGSLDASAPEARAEHIAGVAWVPRERLTALEVFPRVIVDRYWTDRERGFHAPLHLPLRPMAFW